MLYRLRATVALLQNRIGLDDPIAELPAVREEIAAQGVG